MSEYKDEMSALQDDVSLSGYRKYLAFQAAPLPLTAAEEELRQIKLSSVRTHADTHQTPRTLCGYTYRLDRAPFLDDIMLHVGAKG